MRCQNHNYIPHFEGYQVHVRGTTWMPRPTSMAPHAPVLEPNDAFDVVHGFANADVERSTIGNRGTNVSSEVGDRLYQIRVALRLS